MYIAIKPASLLPYLFSWVANEDVNPGALLLVDAPLAVAPNIEDDVLRGDYCMHCLKLVGISIVFFSSLMSKPHDFHLQILNQVYN
jgi:hypothetical protein